MRVIPPITYSTTSITAAMLTSTTVVETPPAAYNAGTTYSTGQIAYVGTVGGVLTVYKSLQNSNTGHTPASSPTWWQNIGDTYAVYDAAHSYALGETVIDATNHITYESLANGNLGNALTDTTKWLDIGPTNRWKMFDLLRNTQTDVPSPLTVTITPGERVNSIALFGLVATSATITVTSDGSTVYTNTEDLNNRDVFDWYDYFFEPFSTRPTVVAFDLPPYTNAVISITLSNSDGNVKCGGLVIGNYLYLGKVLSSPESDVLNFSKVTRDEFGNSELVQRRNVPKTNQTVITDKIRVDKIRAIRDSLNALPAVWSGLDDARDDYFESLFILGYYRRFTINLAQNDHAQIALELEEI